MIIKILKLIIKKPIKWYFFVLVNQNLVEYTLNKNIYYVIIYINIFHYMIYSLT